jgi:rhodanese-related sulfurtransferase
MFRSGFELIRRRGVMKTITPFELQMLIDKRDVELIDVRPTKEFKAVHALVARSIPLSRLEPHSVVAHRKLDRRAPLYIMSREKALASLAACSLAGTGLVESVVVEGGIEGWEGQCLPMVRNKPWRPPEINISKAAMPAGLCLVRRGFALLVAFFATGIAAVLRAFGLAHRRYQPGDEPSSWRQLAPVFLTETPKYETTTRSLAYPG